MKSGAFHFSPKINQTFGLLWYNPYTKYFQKSPNLATLYVADILNEK